MQVQYSPPLISKLSYPPTLTIIQEIIMFCDLEDALEIVNSFTLGSLFWLVVPATKFWHMVARKRNVPCLLAKFTIPGVFPPFDFVFTLPKVEEQYWTFLSSQSSFKYRSITLWLHYRNVKSKSVSTVITAGHIFLSNTCACDLN